MPNVDDVVDDILEQLKESKKECTSLTKTEETVTKDNLEQFVIEKSSKLVLRALDIIDDIKDRTCSTNDPEEVRALADIMKATSSAVDALNKVHISSERNKTAKEISKANIEARVGINTQNNQTKLMMSREEAMKKLFDAVNKDNVVEAEIIKE